MFYIVHGYRTRPHNDCFNIVSLLGGSLMTTGQNEGCAVQLYVALRGPGGVCGCQISRRVDLLTVNSFSAK